MVVVEIGSGDISATGRKRTGSNTTRALRKVELTDFLATCSLPDVHGWRWSSFSGNNCGSVSADVDGQDVISVEGLVCVLMLRAHFSSLATIEGLLASGCIHDDTKGGNHVQSLALSGVSPTQITCKVIVRFFTVCTLTDSAGSRQLCSHRHARSRILARGLPCLPLYR